MRMTITVGGLPPVRSRTTPKMFRNALPSLLRGSNARPSEEAAVIETAKLTIRTWASYVVVLVGFVRLWKRRADHLCFATPCRCLRLRLPESRFGHVLGLTLSHPSPMLYSGWTTRLVLSWIQMKGRDPTLRVGQQKSALRPK